VPARKKNGSSLEIAPMEARWQKPRFLPAPELSATRNSAEIAAGDFSQ
jgi:hypothetical protein